MSQPAVKVPRVGDFAEVLAGPHRGLVGTVQAFVQGRDELPRMGRLRLQTGVRIAVPATDLEKVDGQHGNHAA